MAGNGLKTHGHDLSPEARQRIEHLVHDVRERPESAAAFVELSRAYVEVWANDSAPAAFARVERGLERSMDLDSVAYAVQIRQVLNYMADHARSQGLQDAGKRVRALEKRLQSRLDAARNASLPPPKPVPEAPPPAAPEPPPPPPWASALGASPFAPPPAPTTTAEAPPAPRAPAPSAPKPRSAGPAVDAAIPRATAFAATALSQEDEIGEPDEDLRLDAEETGEPPQEAKPSPLPDPESLRQIDGLFAKDQVDGVLTLYASLSDPRLKRVIIGRLVEKIPDYKVAPLLAIGAMESDKQVFRHMMHVLLSGDRSRICQQIDLAQLSPDLRRVGVVVLSQLKSRAALPKLQKALECADPVVRSVALHGIGSAGEAALEQIPALVAAARNDPNPHVRLDAAKAIAAVGTVQAYDALQAAALEAHLDPPVLKAVERMRVKFDPDGSRLARKVAGLRQKADRANGRTSQQLHDAEKMVAAQQRMLQRVKEKADRDPEVVAARKRKEMLTKALVFVIVVVLPALYLAYEYLGPTLRVIAASVTPDGPHYND